MREEFSKGTVFVYFKDYQNSCKTLYEMGFEAVCDFDFAQIFSVCDGFFIGAVNYEATDKRITEQKGVMFGITVRNAEELGKVRQRLCQYSFEPSDIKLSTRLPYACFTVNGPEGYRFEFGYYTDVGIAAILSPPQG